MSPNRKCIRRQKGYLEMGVSIAFVRRAAVSAPSFEKQHLPRSQLPATRR